MSHRSVYFSGYTIGTDAYDEVVKVCSLYGRRILLIGGKKALQAAQKLLLSAISGSSLKIVDTLPFSGECTETEVEMCCKRARELNVDMIFGMGGGKALDTAKCTAQGCGLPVFTFPTIASTCAASTALSVVYKEDGNFSHFAFFERPAQHCFIHLQVIADAPARYLRAGMGDTIGKFFECHFAARGDCLTHSSALGREISNMCYQPLLDYGVQALSDCQAHLASEALEQAVLANIISTGLVSVLVLDEYNCAIAHSVYYGLILLPEFEERYLHGDVVAYGVLVQLAVDNDLERLHELRHFMNQLEIPVSLAQMQIPCRRDVLQPVLTETVTGPDMEHIPYPVTEDMIFEAMQLIETI